MVVRDDVLKAAWTTDARALPDSACAELSLNATRLPPTIAYFDDYDEVERVVRAEESQWRIRLNGVTAVFEVDSFPMPHRSLLHALAVVGLPSAPNGTCKAIQNFFAHPRLLESTAESAVQGPLVGLSFVRRALGRIAPHESGFAAAKTLLRAMARLEWFGWTEDDLHALRQIHNPLASPQQSPVEDGEVLLSLAEQRDINEHFEDLAAGLAEDRHSMPWQNLRAAAMLYWNYSNGFRPLQIAKLNTEDVRIRPGSQEHPTPTVVVRVAFVKQRKSRIKRFSARRMRRAWTPIMTAWMEVRSNDAAGFDRPRSLFGLPPQDVSSEITRYVIEITGVRRTPYDMRHTAAQRLADVGANRTQHARLCPADADHRGHAGRHRRHRGRRPVSVVSSPTRTFSALVADYRKVAEDAGLAWNQRLSGTGAVTVPERWNLTEIAGSPGETIYLSHLGTDKKTLAEMNRRRAERGEQAMEASALPLCWQDLLRTLVVKHLVAEKRTPGHAAWNVAHPARCLATCCFPKEPWETTPEDVRRGLDIIQSVSAGGARNAEAVARWMSAERLTHAHPLVGPRKIGLPNFNPRSAKDIRSNLDERKRLSRLPGEKEFWELVRIALDEKPSSLFDELRLAACLIQVLMGLRVGEVATLPADALHARDLTTANGARPSDVGGRNRILYLRHFSEKQAGADARGIVWAEKSTSVMTLFEEIIEQTVNDVLARTAPLRQRLKAQNETGRIFPELDPEQPLSLADTYPRVTGNPVVCRDDPQTDRLLAAYRETGDIEYLQNIERRQATLYADGAPLHRTVEVFAKRSRQDGMPWRDALTGDPVKPRQRFARGGMIVHVCDLEDFLREKKSTKLSDQTPFLLSGGRTLATHELLFLHPKRALNEGRNGGVCDITRYPFVGHLQPEDIQAALQDRDNGLFAKYGADEESRSFELNSHSIRHLHNNELGQCPPEETESPAQKAWREKLSNDVEHLRRFVATEPGQHVFPDGDDHGSPYAPRPESLL